MFQTFVNLCVASLLFFFPCDGHLPSELPADSLEIFPRYPPFSTECVSDICLKRICSLDTFSVLDDYCAIYIYLLTCMSYLAPVIWYRLSLQLDKAAVLLDIFRPRDERCNTSECAQMSL